MTATQIGPRVKPSGGIDLFAWYFMRLSGIVLLFMALYHFSIMHVFKDSWTIDYNWVAQRFSTPFWRTYDIILLFLALLHGTNGIRYIINDYIHPKGWRVFLLSVIFVMTLLFFIYGASGILTFQPKSQVKADPVQVIPLQAN